MRQVFFSFGAMIGAMITMHAAVATRQREIGTLRALGFSKLSILTSFLLESVALSLFGGVLGATAALGMQFAHFSIVNFAMSKEADFNDNIDLVRCKNLKAGISVGALLRKKIRINSIYMDGAQIQLVKNSSISYADFISRIIETKKNPDAPCHGDVLAELADNSKN